MTSEDVFGRVDVFRTQIERVDVIPQSHACRPTERVLYATPASV